MYFVTCTYCERNLTRCIILKAILSLLMPLFN
jgi:hypothetical protein